MRQPLSSTNDSWRVDETYIEIKGEWKYLYRAKDSVGNILDFMLSAKRDGKAAVRFFRNVLKASHGVEPRVINGDKNVAYPVAMETLRKDKTLTAETELPQVKCLNNRIEQDYRTIKRIVKPMMRFRLFNTARRTLRRMEAMNMIRKGQIQGIEKGDVRAQVEFMSHIFGVGA